MTVGSNKFVRNCARNRFISCQDPLFLRSKPQGTSGLDQMSYWSWNSYTKLFNISREKYLMLFQLFTEKYFGWGYGV